MRISRPGVSITIVRVIDAAPPEPLSFRAADGYVLRGYAWRHYAGADPAPRPAVVVNAATSVRCDYYARFAAYLHRHGFDVFTYDYRGIGNSRPSRLRGFDADWLHWGELDCEAALQQAVAGQPSRSLYVVGHSIGGFLVGLAASNARVERMFTVGAQFAYWRDYLRSRRPGMLLKWHLAMPLLTALLGYLPGKRLGWLEDTPRGVVRDWTARAPRFEDAYRGAPRCLDAAARAELVERFAAMRAQILAFSLDDDEFGTVAATQRLMRYYRDSRVTHRHLTPSAAGMAPVGHFAFFHSRYERTLWPLALAWLQDGRVPTDAPGALTPPAAPRPHQPERGRR